MIPTGDFRRTGGVSLESTDHSPPPPPPPPPDSSVRRLSFSPLLHFSDVEDDGVAPLQKGDAARFCLLLRRAEL
ncbi:hypothetical protein EYF80_038268 [Liparis tanakae]|uniref:Uncharacterized protein n=1 Tax=Liparis tanakae TaxID=230148 RepID=A0A4Z2GD81_9TELE|nr:hypothetical protein EYF80_038268 [Liparis tanakae]